MNSAERSFDDFNNYDASESNFDSETAIDSDCESSVNPSEVCGPAVRNTLLGREEFVPMPKTSAKSVEKSDAQPEKQAESKQPETSKKRGGKAATPTGASTSAPKRRRSPKTSASTSDDAPSEPVKETPSRPSTPGKVNKRQRNTNASRTQRKRELLLDLIELVDTSYPL